MKKEDIYNPCFGDIGSLRLNPCPYHVAIHCECDRSYRSCKKCLYDAIKLIINGLVSLEVKGKQERKCHLKSK